MSEQTQKAQQRFRALLEKQELEQWELLREIQDETERTNAQAAASVRTDVGTSVEGVIDQIRTQILSDGRNERLNVSFRATAPADTKKLKPVDPHDPDRLQAIIYVQVPSVGERPKAYALLEVTNEVFTYVNPDSMRDGIYVRG